MDRRLLPGLILLLAPAVTGAAVPASDSGYLYPGRLFLSDGGYIHGFAIGDLNGDALPDVAALEGNFIRLLVNDGRGELVVGESTLHVGDHPDIHIADINGDGHADLLATYTNGGDAMIRVFKGGGDGNFIEHGNFLVGPDAPDRIAVGDVNTDGAVDIVWISTVPAVGGVLLGDGNGAFSPGPSLETGTSPIDVEIADINEDGAADVLIAHGPARVSAWMNNGETLGDTPVTVLEFSSDYAITDIEIADVDSDGHTDIALALHTDGTDGTRLFFGKGDGEFSECWNYFGSGSHILAVDMNGDESLDLVTMLGEKATTWFATGKCDFYKGGTFHIPTGMRGMTRIADLTRDGRPDFVAATGAAIEVVASNGGSHSARREFLGGGRNSDVELADVTGDGILDFIHLNYQFGHVLVWPRYRSGDARGPYIYTVGRGGDHPPQDVDIADVTGDGVVDMLVANPDRHSVGLLRGTGSGEFDPVEEYPTGYKPRVMAIADVTGDGRPDVLTGSALFETVSLLENDGSGGFLKPKEFAANQSPSIIAVADVVGDGNLDVVVHEEGSSFVTVLAGDGEGDFAPAVDHEAGADCRIFVMDITGDGISEIVCADEEGIRTVDTGERDTATIASKPGPPGEGAKGYALSDVNGDNRVDLVFVNGIDPWVEVRLGDGSGKYLRTLHFATDEYSVDLAITDMTGDGRLDIVTTQNEGVRGVTILPHFNPAPTANSATIAVDEDGLAYGLLLASDPENEDLVFSVIDSPSPAADLTFNDSAGRSFTYRYSHGWIEDKFTFVTHDGTSYSNVAAITLRTNFAPSAFSSDIEVEEGGVVSGSLGANDPEEDALFFQLVEKPRYGVVTITDPATGEFIYESRVGADDRFTFVAHDGFVESNVAEIRISVRPKADTPDDEQAGEDEPGLSPRPGTSQGSGGGSFGLAGLLVLTFFRRRRLAFPALSRATSVRNSVEKAALLLAATAMIAGCSTVNIRSQPPSSISAASLKEGAIFVGSVLLSDTRTDELVFLWGGEYAASIVGRTRIKGETFVPVEGRKGFALGYFAVTEIDGNYSYSSEETAHAVIAASKPVRIGNATLIKRYSPAHRNEWVNSEAVGRGNFVYVGRFVCIPRDDACEWDLVDESGTDVSVLQKLNPNLPWDDLMTLRGGELHCVNGSKYLARDSDFPPFRRFGCASE